VKFKEEKKEDLWTKSKKHSPRALRSYPRASILTISKKRGSRKGKGYAPNWEKVSKRKRNYVQIAAATGTPWTKSPT